MDSLPIEFEGVDLESFAGVAGGLPGFVFGLERVGRLWWDKVGDDPFFVSGLGSGGWNELRSDGCGCAIFLVFGVIGWLFQAGMLLLPVLFFSAFTAAIGAGVAYGLLATGRFLFRPVWYLFKRSYENHGK